MYEEDFSITVGIIVLILVILSLGRGFLADPLVAEESLDAQGFSNIEITGHDWFLIGFRGCGDSDAAKFIATAKNPAGKTVEVFVCTGWPFKGTTIRT